MKKLEIVLVAAIATVLGSIVGPTLVGPLYIRHRFTPRQKAATIQDLEKDFRVTMEVRRLTIEGVEYTLAKGPLIHWAAPSGPPMYVFDSQGRVLDYTLDVGDDPRFRETWIHGTNSSPGR